VGNSKSMFQCFANCFLSRYCWLISPWNWNAVLIPSYFQGFWEQHSIRQQEVDNHHNMLTHDKDVRGNPMEGFVSFQSGKWWSLAPV
jgi:hypothetical protein